MPAFKRRGLWALAGALVASTAAGLWLARTGTAAVRFEKPITIVVTFPPGGGTDLLARRLGAALQHQITRGLEGDRILEIRGHRPIKRVALVLPVDDRRHALHRLGDLGLAGDAVGEPVGDVLRGDAQRRPILHQADVRRQQHEQQLTGQQQRRLGSRQPQGKRSGQRHKECGRNCQRVGQA